ncbi:MAG TPA: hypothetical protein VGJ48_09660 [Pyrinomonadaceae bacterium]|jgi:hypothetical protein|nr:hypothetical protein [Pyrinomonadaceae bacterium]
MKKSNLLNSARVALALGSVLALALLPLAPVDRSSAATSLNPVTSELAVTFTQVADSATAIRTLQQSFN